jgi:hypothetical protein
MLHNTHVGRGLENIRLGLRNVHNECRVVGLLEAVNGKSFKSSTNQQNHHALLPASTVVSACIEY